MLDRFKKASEKRIEQRAKKVYGDNEWKLPENVKRGAVTVAQHGINAGRRAYGVTQERKAQGKAIVKRKLKQLFAGTKTGTRELVRGSKKRRRRK